jgi:hypothetical protein
MNPIPKIKLTTAKSRRQRFSAPFYLHFLLDGTLFALLSRRMVRAAAVGGDPSVSV